MKPYIISLLLFTPFASGALADPAPEVHPQTREEKGLFLLPKVKPANRKEPRERKGTPQLTSPAVHEARFKAPSLGAPDRSIPEGYIPRFSPRESGCHVMYAELLKERRMGRAGMASALALTAAAGGYAYSQIPKPEEVSPAQLAKRSPAELIKQAQEFLKDKYRGGFGKKDDLHYGHFLLQSEFADNAESLAPGDLADAATAYDELLEKTKAIAASREPFLKKIQRVRDLALSNPGVLSGYCRGKSMLTSAMLDHCVNCDSSTKTFVSLLLDSKFPMEKPYELGAQLFSDHIQAVLVNPKEKKVLVLESGALVKGYRSDIYKPDLLLYGYLAGKKVDTVVDRSKDLLMAKVDVIAKKLNAQGSATSDSKSNYGAAANAFSEGTPPEFSARANGSIGEKGGASTGRDGAQYSSVGLALQCNTKATLSPGVIFDNSSITVSTNTDTTIDTIATRPASFGDPELANEWNKSSALGKLNILKRLARTTGENLGQEKEIQSSLTLLAQGKYQPGSQASKKLEQSLSLWHLTLSKLKSEAMNLLPCLEIENVKIDGTMIEKQLFDDPFSSSLKDKAHTLAMNVADNPMKFLAEYKKIPDGEKEQWLKNISTIGRTSEILSRLPGKYRSIFSSRRTQMSQDFYRSPAGNLYSPAAPLTGLMATLNDRRKVDIGTDQPGEKPTPRRPDEVDLPEVPLLPGTYGGIVVLPREQKKSAKRRAELMMDVSSMARIIETGLRDRPSLSNPSLSSADIAGRLTPELIAEIEKNGVPTAPMGGVMFSPGFGSVPIPYSYQENSNIELSRIPFSKIEALKTLPVFRERFGEPRVVFSADDPKSIYTATSYLEGMAVPPEKRATLLKFIAGPAKVSDAQSPIIFELSGQSFAIEVENSNPKGTTRISLLNVTSWYCGEKKCEGPVSLARFLNDPNMQAVKAELMGQLTPKQKRKFAEWGIK